MRMKQMNLGNIWKRDPGVSDSSQIRITESSAMGERSARALSEVKSLTPGQTIQGEVIARSGKAVQIAIAGELLVNARLEQNVNILPGQSMCFEILSNNGRMLSLSPLYANMANGETIVKALTEAGLPQTRENMDMVSMMMEEGMSIDKEAVQMMSRQLVEFPAEEALTLIRMTRLQIPVTQENIEQFGQYSNMQHQLVGSAERIMDEIPQLYGELAAQDDGQKAVQFLKGLLDIFIGESEPGVGESAFGEPQQSLVQTEQPPEDGRVAVADAQQPNTERILSQEMTIVSELAGEKPQEEGVHSVQADSSGLSELAEIARGLGMDTSDIELLQSGKLPAKELLRFVRQLLENRVDERTIKESLRETGDLHRLLGDKTFQGMLKEELLKQWTIRPEEVAQKDEVARLYERIREQSGRLISVLEHVGKAESALGQNVQNLQNNVDFMNQLNQIFTYVQLPLKMSGQNTHGDLYIYTNKKSLASKDGNVSAVLHLDMEHLGMVDVYVTMQNQKVGTNFTLEDEAAMDLVAEHIDELERRLAARGYELNAKMCVKEETAEEEETILKTMLEQSKNISMLSHTSFDMRA